VAELDDDAQLKDQDAGPSVQQVYLQAVQSLLKEEFGPSAVTQELKKHLEENDLWP
jgi:cobalamin biosynthesis protein CbiG